MNWHGRQSGSADDSWIRLAVFVTSVACVAVFAGCNGCNSKGGNASLTPVQHFEVNQANAMTPHGRVISGSARDLGNGCIQYQTDDGSKWTVRYTKMSEGYRYDNPERIEPLPLDVQD